MTQASPLSRLEKLAESKYELENEPERSRLEEAFLDGYKAALSALSEPGEACGPLSDPFNSHKYEDLAKEIYAWGNPSTWDVFVRGARSGFRDGRAEATLQARAAQTQLTARICEECRTRERAMKLLADSEEVIAEAKAALASSEARVRELEKALEKIAASTCKNKTQTHTINIDTANDALFELGAIARAALASVLGTKGEA